MEKLETFWKELLSLEKGVDIENYSKIRNNASLALTWLSSCCVDELRQSQNSESKCKELFLSELLLKVDSLLQISMKDEVLKNENSSLRQILHVKATELESIQMFTQQSQRTEEQIQMEIEEYQTYAR